MPQTQDAPGLSPTAQVKEKKKSQAWYNPRAGEAEAGISPDKHSSLLLKLQASETPGLNKQGGQRQENATCGSL